MDEEGCSMSSMFVACRVYGHLCGVNAVDLDTWHDDMTSLHPCVAPPETVQTAIACPNIREGGYTVFGCVFRIYASSDTRTGNEHPRTYGRNHAVSTYLLKTFGRLRTARHRVAAYIGMVGQSANTDGDCIQSLVLEHLRPRKEKRKIVFVFSDGEPCGDYQEQRLAEVVKNLSDDYEIIGFGMESYVGDYYPNNVSVYDMDTLVGKVAKQVGQMLLGKKFKEPKHEATQSWVDTLVCQPWR